MTPFATALLQDIALFTVLIALGAFIAKKRGRNIYIWGAAGVLVIPTIVNLLLSRKNQNDEVESN